MSTAAANAWSHDHGNVEDIEYSAFLDRVNKRFHANIAAGERPLFTTDASGLWDTYLGSFSDPDERQHHNCNTCRHFIERFGGLVTIDDGGSIDPAVWNEDDAPEHYKAAIRGIVRLVRRASVTGVFLSSEATLGQPTTGDWQHLSVTLPRGVLHRNGVLTAGQKMAEKREDFGIVQRALAEFTADHVNTALRLLQSDTLYQSEKVLGQAQFLDNLHQARADAVAGKRNNVVWLAVAKAPAGFCHPRSSMIGTLLEDIAAGMEFDQVSRRFAEKMHPLRYQRPQVAPAAGNIAQAEKLFATLGLAPALERRIARLHELPMLWEPKQQAPKPSTSGIFGHLQPKEAVQVKSLQMPEITMTLQKFVQTIVPTVEQLEVLLGGGRHAFMAITTAMNSEAPRMFQWDHPFAWYVWHGGSLASQFGLSPGWAKVSGITRLPARWNDTGECFKHHGDGLVVLLEGARESRAASAGLFPSLLRAELHGVRAVIEAHSRSAEMQGLVEGSAIGIDLRAPGALNTTVRTTSAGQQQVYKIDRWD